MLCLQLEMMETNWARGSQGEAGAKSIEIYQRVCTRLRRLAYRDGPKTLRLASSSTSSMNRLTRRRTYDASAQGYTGHAHQRSRDCVSGQGEAKRGLSYAQACRDPNLFGPWFSGASWSNWRVLDKVIFAESLDTRELAIWQELSGPRRSSNAAKERGVANRRPQRRQE